MVYRSLSWPCLHAFPVEPGEPLLNGLSLGNSLHRLALFLYLSLVILQQAKKDQPYLDNYYQIGIQGEAGAAWGGGAGEF
jgi:hypothetical protein